MKSSQADWNQKTEDRISLTSTVLESIKSIKILGFTQYVIDDLTKLRETEIKSSKTFRWKVVFINLLGRFLTLINHRQLLT